MKNITKYIKESLKPEEIFITALKDNKFTKEQVVNMLMNMDMKNIKNLSDNFKKTYNDEYFVYEPSKDDFLKTSEKENIVNKIAEFILKFICK